MGYGILHVDVESFQIIKAKAFTIRGTKSIYLRDWEIDFVHGQYARINAHKKEFSNILLDEEPDILICESPFFNPRMPNAFEVLVRVMTMLRDTYFEWNSWRDVHTVDPPTAKKSFGGTGSAKKDDMAALLRSNVDLEPFMKDLTPIDEHSVDALAVAYHMYKTLKKSRL